VEHNPHIDQSDRPGTACPRRLSRQLHNSFAILLCRSAEKRLITKTDADLIPKNRPWLDSILGSLRQINLQARAHHVSRKAKRK
jgi:hypothetical protein